jgi:hypothetical protein
MPSGPECGWPRTHWHRTSFIWLPVALLMAWEVVVVVVYTIILLLLYKQEGPR